MPESTLSENTSIRIGLVLMFISILATGIWWAASVSTKLDVVLTNQAAVSLSVAKQSTDLLALQERVKTIELVGSTPMVLRIGAMEREIDELRAKVNISK